jgi:hypothetical protein
MPSYSIFQEYLNITRNLLHFGINGKFDLKITTYLKFEDMKVTCNKRLTNKTEFSHAEA